MLPHSVSTSPPTRIFGSIRVYGVLTISAPAADADKVVAEAESTPPERWEVERIGPAKWHAALCIGAMDNA